jgi:type IV pilus assembly protein PilB
MSALFDQLISQGLVTTEQLQDARAKQVGAKKPIHELLVEMGFIKEGDLLKASSKVFNMQLCDLEKEKIDQEAVDLIPYDLAERHGVFPVRRSEGSLILAMSNPQDVIAMDEIRTQANLKVKPILCSKSSSK